MKPSLQLRLAQQLALTPQLQQSIRLLQLSTLELQQELQQILADNPFLERLDDPLEHSISLLPDGALPASVPLPQEAVTNSNDIEEKTTADFSDPQNSSSETISDETDWGNNSSQNSYHNEDDENSLQHIAARPITLREHLIDQLHTTQSSMRDRGLVTFLIDSLNENGFLEQDLENLWQIFPTELEVEIDELKTALSLLQSFEPTGVGARNLGECLCLQLNALKLRGVAHRTRLLALELVGSYLTELGERNYAQIRKSSQCEEDDLRAALELIRTLNPRPGNAFSQIEKNYIIPDVIVRKQKGQWIVKLNQEVIPRLRINPSYAKTLRSMRTRARNKAGATEPAPQEGSATPTGIPMQAQLQEARWCIKNIHQRFDTILRVAQAIVERQKNFFLHGEVGMRPLVLREIADTLELHESTISRVTTQKYMLTPFGTFELKFFFGSHVATDSGGTASSTAIRALIKQLIGAENPKKPLSDSQLAELLGEQGFVVARRTVAKYREALKIPTTSIRKKL